MPIFSGTLFSENIDKKIKFKAIIPAPGSTKEANVETKGLLKTLYLLHGWNGNYEDWSYYSNIVMLAEQNNLAVIMPDGENSFYSNHHTGAHYEKFYAEELISQTRFLFPLSNKREDTFIGGLSMGGYGALKLGFKYEELFGKIFAFSSRILTQNEKHHELDDSNLINTHIKTLFNIDAYKQLSSSDDIYEIIKSAENKPELLLACGEDDYLINENEELHRWLIKQGINHEYITGDGEHTWEYWSKHINTGIDWLIK